MLIKVSSVILPVIQTLLEPIRATFEVIGAMISGNSEGLTKTEKLLGGITGSLLLIKGAYMAINALQTLRNSLTVAGLTLQESILAKMFGQDAVLSYQIAKEEGKNTLAAIYAGFQETILGKMIMQGYEFVKQIGQGVILD